MGVDLICGPVLCSASYSWWSAFKIYCARITVIYLRKVWDDEKKIPEEDQDEDYESWHERLGELLKSFEGFDLTQNIRNSLFGNHPFWDVAFAEFEQFHTLTVLIHYKVNGTWTLINSPGCEGAFSPGMALDMKIMFETIKIVGDGVEEDDYSSTASAFYRVCEYSVAHLQEIRLG